MVDELRLREFEIMATARDSYLAISEANAVLSYHTCWVRD